MNLPEADKDSGPRAGGSKVNVCEVVHHIVIIGRSASLKLAEIVEPRKGTMHVYQPQSLLPCISHVICIAGQNIHNFVN